MMLKRRSGDDYRRHDLVGNIQMMDESADTQTAAETAEAVENEDKESRERSTIGFPYVPLDDAVSVATAIQHKVGSGILSDDILAPALDLSHKSSGYRTKLSAARLFGLIESVDGGHKLADLGKRVVDGKQARAAKAEAFLRIPLYSRVYEEHKGGTVPPAAALEREFLSFGVAPKQTSRARQVLERSAEQAGFYEVGRDRLVRPAIKQGESADNPAPDKHKGKGGGGSGGGDDFTEGLDPLIAGLIRRVKPAGEEWKIEERARWLQALADNLSFIHGDTLSDPAIKVAVVKAPESPA
jgi:hypothetical protein